MGCEVPRARRRCARRPSEGSQKALHGHDGRCRVRPWRPLLLNRDGVLKKYSPCPVCGASEELDFEWRMVVVEKPGPPELGLMLVCLKCGHARAAT